jgi:hypothetical protein
MMCVYILVLRYCALQLLSEHLHIGFHDDQLRSCANCCNFASCHLRLCADFADALSSMYSSHYVPCNYCFCVSNATCCALAIKVARGYKSLIVFCRARCELCLRASCSAHIMSILFNRSTCQSGSKLPVK